MIVSCSRRRMLTRQQNDEDSAVLNQRSTPLASDFLFFQFLSALASQVLWGLQRKLKRQIENGEWIMSNLSYDVFVNDPPPQHGLLPNGEPKRFSPVASTLIYGSENAVLTDPAFTTEQARVLGDWVAAKGRKLTDIFITHRHGDHWCAAGLLAERFGARVVATAGTIAQMHGNVAAPSGSLGQGLPGIPPSPVTAVRVPVNRFTLEGHDLVIVEAGHSDSADTSILQRPDLGLVVGGDVIYNGAHMYLGASAAVENIQQQNTKG